MFVEVYFLIALLVVFVLCQYALYLNDIVPTEFEKFIKKWKQESNYLDINTEIIDDAYYRILVKEDFWIIGQLLSALRDYPIGCSMVLTKITGYNPVKDADSTNIDMIIEGWRKWNNRHPYVENL